MLLPLTSVRPQLIGFHILKSNSVITKLSQQLQIKLRNQYAELLRCSLIKYLWYAMQGYIEFIQTMKNFHCFI